MSEVQLLKRDMTLIVQFQSYCNLKGLKRFSADDFREFGLHEQLKDPAHDVGRIFRTMILSRQARKVAWTPSRHEANHGRAIRLYEWET